MYRFSLTDSSFLPHLGCDLELTLNKGELNFLVGQNGIGKSTLLERLLQDPFFLISYIPQKPLDYFYDRTLGQVKKLFMEQCEEPEEREKLSDYWRRFQLDQKENRFQSLLSGGESQTLKLCLGLAVRREIYFLDEPSQYLDEKMKTHLGLILKEMLKQSKTILMVEHDPLSITLSGRVIELEIKNQTLKIGRTWSI